MAIFITPPLLDTSPSDLDNIAIANLVGAFDVLIQMDLKLNGYPEIAEKPDVTIRETQDD